MNEFIAKGRTLAEAYHNALLILDEHGVPAPCPDYSTTQKEVSMTISVEQPLSEPMISKCFIGGPKELEQYRQEILYGILDFEIERGKWVYTYHNRIVDWCGHNAAKDSGKSGIDQIQFVIRDLKRNPSSRRAAICIRTAEDVDSEDPACLQHIQYFIRDGKLHCKVLFRSNDACKATFMNAFALIQLQKMVADELGVQMGTYTHRANSFHCYERDFEMLKQYVKRIESAQDEDDICYDYEDGWDELMEDSKPEIAQMVEELRARS